MKLREVLNLVGILIVLQGGVGVVILALIGDTPGVDLYSVAVTILLLVVVSSVIGVVLYWLISRYTKERAIKTAMMTMSEDEQRVLREIMRQEEARQDELRRELGFSKSKLSALVNNLVDKNAVEKTRYKRTNKLRPTEQFQK